MNFYCCLVQQSLKLLLTDICGFRIFKGKIPFIRGWKTHFALNENFLVFEEKYSKVMFYVTIIINHEKCLGACSWICATNYLLLLYLTTISKEISMGSRKSLNYDLIVLHRSYSTLPSYKPPPPPQPPPLRLPLLLR